MSTNIQEIIEKDIFELTDLNHLPEEKRQELFEKAEETIINNVMLRVADQLEEAEIIQFRDLMLAGDNAAVTQFLATKEIDLEELIASEAIAYKVQMASLTEALKPNYDAN